MGFFFTQKKDAPKKNNHTDLLELAYDQGCKVCPLSKLSLASTRMKPIGNTSPDVYVLGSFPTELEEKYSLQFLGEPGQLVRDLLNKHFKEIYYEDEWRIPRKSIINFKSKFRFSNCLTCTTPKGRVPIDLELDCCRKALEKDIEESKPKIILGFGKLPLKWMLKVNNPVEDWRGRRIPVKIGNHTTWFFPLLDPQEDVLDRRNKKNPSFETEWDKVFRMDLKNVADFLFNSASPKPIVIDKGYTDNIHYVLGDKPEDLETVRSWLTRLKKFPKTALDIESNDLLRPYHKHAAIYTIAIGTYDEMYAFPVMHPKAWNGNFSEISALLKDFLLHSGRKIAHNLKFEQEWFAHFFGQEVLFETEWADTMGQAYVLDERCSKSADSMLSLNTLTLLRFGFRLKKLSAGQGKRIVDSPLKDVLIYNGMDAKYEYLLEDTQDKDLSRSLIPVYQHTVDTCSTLALTQAQGLPVDSYKVQEFSDDLEDQIEQISKKIQALPEAQEYTRLTGIPFNQDSPDHLVTAFRDILKLPQVKETAGKGYSTDKEVLDTFAAQGVELAVLIKDNRELTKLKSTYVDSIPDLLKMDGILHTEFNHLFTSTGRLSSEDPNMQNFPKRKNKYVRNIITAPKDHWIVSVDYGQIEARVIAMASKDSVFCKAIWEDYDVHKEWAINIVKRHPEAVGARTFDEWMSNEDKVKKYRNVIKNKLVFPWFFGASKYSVARSLNLPDDVATEMYTKFWKMFKGVKEWQEDLLAFYDKNGYVSTLTGRRRRAPMSHNEIINSPIQGTASDIVVNAMNRLSKLAYKIKKPQYQARLNVHDDLTFIIPDRTLEQDIEFIAKEMCIVPFNFVNVPISIEVAIGKMWGEMEDMTKFSTVDFAA